MNCDFLPVGPAYGAGKVICDLGLTRGGRNRLFVALSCDFLPGGRLTRPAKSFVIWVSQGDGEESAVPVNGLVSGLGSGLVVGLAAREMIKIAFTYGAQIKAGKAQ